MIDTKSRNANELAQLVADHIDDLVAEQIDPASIYTIITCEEGWWRARITWVGLPEKYQNPTLKRPLNSEEQIALRQAKQPAAQLPYGD